MEAYLRPLFSYRLYTTIIGQKKKDPGKPKKWKKYSRKNVCFRITYNSLFVCVCVCVCVRV